MVIEFEECSLHVELDYDVGDCIIPVHQIPLISIVRRNELPTNLY